MIRFISFWRRTRFKQIVNWLSANVTRSVVLPVPVPRHFSDSFPTARSAHISFSCVSPGSITPRVYPVGGVIYPIPFCLCSRPLPLTSLPYAGAVLLYRDGVPDDYPHPAKGRKEKDKWRRPPPVGSLPNITITESKVQNNELSQKIILFL